MRREKAQARVLPLILLTLALAGYGCGARSDWENRKYPRPLSEEAREQLARDKYECHREHYGRLAQMCMEARGWFPVQK